MKFVVAVRDLHNKYGTVYHFMTNDTTLQKGDTVVVDSANGMYIGTIVDIPEQSEWKKVTKWVVCKIDLTEFEKNKAREVELAKLKKQLDAKRKVLEEAKLYDILAEQDEEFAQTLKEYKQLMEEGK